MLFINASVLSARTADLNNPWHRNGSRDDPSFFHQEFIVKSKHAFAVSTLLALAAHTALAEGPVQGFEPVRPPSTLSRAEVQAQAAEATKQGRYVRGEFVSSAPRAPSTLTREQVIAEMIEHRRLGLTPRGNHYPQATPQQAEQIRQAGLRAAHNAALARSGAATEQVR